MCSYNCTRWMVMMMVVVISGSMLVVVGEVVPATPVLLLETSTSLSDSPVCFGGICPLSGGVCCPGGSTCCNGQTKCVRDTHNRMTCSNGVSSLKEQVSMDFRRSENHDTFRSINAAIKKVNSLAKAEVKKQAAPPKQQQQQQPSVAAPKGTQALASLATPPSALQPTARVPGTRVTDTLGAIRMAVARVNRLARAEVKHLSAAVPATNISTTPTTHKLTSVKAPAAAAAPAQADVITRLESMSASKCNSRLGGLMIKDTEKGQPRLDLKQALTDIVAISKLPGVTAKVLGHEDGIPVYWIDMPSTNANAKKRVFISSGVHGDEPIGVTTNLELMARLYKSPLRAQYSFTFVPNVNPGGLRDNMRTNRAGVDMNRLFVSGSFPTHLVNLESNLKQNKYDLSMDLHGAKHRKGFFVIRAAEDYGLSTAALSVIDPTLKLQTDSGTFPGYVALGGDTKKYHLERPGEAMSDNPGTLKGFLHSQGTPTAYTMEYPGSLPVCTRQAGAVSLVMSMLNTHHSRNP